MSEQSSEWVEPTRKDERRARKLAEKRAHELYKWEHRRRIAEAEDELSLARRAEDEERERLRQAIALLMNRDGSVPGPVTNDPSVRAQLEALTSALHGDRNTISEISNIAAIVARRAAAEAALEAAKSAGVPTRRSIRATVATTSYEDLAEFGRHEARDVTRHEGVVPEFEVLHDTAPADMKPHDSVPDELTDEELAAAGSSPLESTDLTSPTITSSESPTDGTAPGGQPAAATPKTWGVHNPGERTPLESVVDVDPQRWSDAELHQEDLSSPFSATQGYDVDDFGDADSTEGGHGERTETQPRTSWLKRWRAASAQKSQARTARRAEQMALRAAARDAKKAEKAAKDAALVAERTARAERRSAEKDEAKEARERARQERAGAVASRKAAAAERKQMRKMRSRHAEGEPTTNDEGSEALDTPFDTGTTEVTSHQPGLSTDHDQPWMFGSDELTDVNTELYNLPASARIDDTTPLSELDAFEQNMDDVESSDLGDADRSSKQDIEGQSPRATRRAARLIRRAERRSVRTHRRDARRAQRELAAQQRAEEKMLRREQKAAQREELARQKSQAKAERELSKQYAAEEVASAKNESKASKDAARQAREEEARSRRDARAESKKRRREERALRRAVNSGNSTLDVAVDESTLGAGLVVQDGTSTVVLPDSPDQGTWTTTEVELETIENFERVSIDSVTLSPLTTDQLLTETPDTEDTQTASNDEMSALEPSHTENDPEPFAEIEELTAKQLKKIAKAARKSEQTAAAAERREARKASKELARAERAARKLAKNERKHNFGLAQIEQKAADEQDSIAMRDERRELREAVRAEKRRVREQAKERRRAAREEQQRVRAEKKSQRVEAKLAKKAERERSKLEKEFAEAPDDLEVHDYHVDTATEQSDVPHATPVEPGQKQNSSSEAVPRVTGAEHDPRVSDHQQGVIDTQVAAAVDTDPDSTHLTAATPEKLDDVQTAGSVVARPEFDLDSSGGITFAETSTTEEADDFKTIDEAREKKAAKAAGTGLRRWLRWIVAKKDAAEIAAEAAAREAKKSERLAERDRKREEKRAADEQRRIEKEDQKQARFEQRQASKIEKVRQSESEKRQSSERRSQDKAERAASKQRAKEIREAAKLRRAAEAAERREERERLAVDKITDSADYTRVSDDVLDDGVGTSVENSSEVDTRKAGVFATMKERVAARRRIKRALIEARGDKAAESKTSDGALTKEEKKLLQKQLQEERRRIKQARKDAAKLRKEQTRERKQAVRADRKAVDAAKKVSEDEKDQLKRSFRNTRAEEKARRKEAAQSVKDESRRIKEIRKAEAAQRRQDEKAAKQASRQEEKYRSEIRKREKKRASLQRRLLREETKIARRAARIEMPEFTVVREEPTLGASYQWDAETGTYNTAGVGSEIDSALFDLPEPLPRR